MQNIEFEWKTSDGLKIFAQLWKPQGEIKAVICLVHGLGEHSSRYKKLPEKLTSQGYALRGFDQRGHGKSEGRRGYTPSYELMLENITLLLQEARKRIPNTPLFLYGHSMGGNLVINYALRKKPDIKGVIVTGPWLKLTHPPGYLLFKAAKFLNRFFPTFRTYNGIKPAELSHDKKRIGEIEEDKYLHPWIAARTFMGVHDAGCFALQHAAEFNYPILIMHGGADNVTSVEASREFAEKVKQNCTFKVWEGLYHEIHNEPRNGEIFAAALEWLNRQNEQRQAILR
ncbi:MAG: lysophospholipase [Methanococcaceae archaeon]